MKYDFDTIIPRRGTNSYKWDTPEEENVLPMWVADMDFRTAPAIIDALQKRVAHGMMRSSGGSMTGIAGRLIPGGLSIRVVSCRLCQPLSKPWPCRVIKSSFRLLPIIVSTHLSVMTDASCLPIISFIRMAAT